MKNPTLDAYQQVFAMACIVGRAAGYHGTESLLQQQLQKDLSFYLSDVPPLDSAQTASVADSAVTPVLGNWKLVWGPVVLEEVIEGIPTGVADNSLFVAECDAVAFPGGPVMPAYVVAVAGTNPDSLYDWGDEDFSVSKVVNWNTYDPSGFTPSPYVEDTPFISKGTATGIQNLLGMVSPDTAAAPGTSLEQFLTGTKPAEDTAVIFCGHSLGGALSPTLALYLKQKNYLDHFALTLVYPTAGPTPGEANFAELFNTTFPALPSGWEPQPLPYQSWNTMHWNSIDVVPHAWDLPDLLKVAKIYGKSPDFWTAVFLDALEGVAVYDATQSGVLYTSIRNSSLEGTPQTSDGKKAINVPPQTITDYVSQLFIQHVDLYRDISFDPVVPGLILCQPLPQPPKSDLVPGLREVTRDELVETTCAQFASWVASRALSAVKPLAEV
ncbi:hypothetical protein [uncultured Chryseobacterium sp.]|uniref:lipase family protein n=1 Tax=uncultured Chryseobacterium sp. TaxID=259322 RepID=UPI003747917D